MKADKKVTDTIREAIEELMILRDNLSDDGFELFAEDIDDLISRLETLLAAINNANNG